MDAADLELYEQENLLQPEGEHDMFTVERYRQFPRHFPKAARTVLGVGCSTGPGGSELLRELPEAELWGPDVVRKRLGTLTVVQTCWIGGISTDILFESQSVDAVVAGEFLEHLLRRDVDQTLCGFQHVLRLRGRLPLTTPNHSYARLTLTKGSIYGPGQLTQHYARVLRTRLMMHGFKNVRKHGSDRVSRYVGEHLPILCLPGPRRQA